MEKTPKRVVFLIPGASPRAAKSLFDAIRVSLQPESDVVELESADKNELQSVALKAERKVLIGKSAGGRAAVNYQLEKSDAEALILLAPGVKADGRNEEIRVPVLILHGTKDRVISIENSRRLAKSLRNSKLVEVPGVGHVFEGRETETARTIREWLNSLNG